MNTVDCYLNQQLGRYVWKEYDNRFTRLRCTQSEEFQNIIPNDDNDMQSTDTPIFACKYAEYKGYEHMLALANEDGYLAIYGSENGESRLGNKIHNNAIFDLTWLCNEMKLITVSGDHTARLVHVANDRIHTSQIFAGHTRSVKTVAARTDDSATFATGGRDGCILVWDIRSNLNNGMIYSIPDKTITLSHQLKSHLSGTPSKSSGTPSKRKVCPTLSGANSVTGLVFQDENTLISCSAGDGKIKFWDLRKTYKISKRAPLARDIIEYSGNTTRNGFSNLLIDKEGIRLYANCLDNNIYCYNVSSCNSNPIMCYTGHQNSTFYVKSCLSNDGKYLLSGSSDQKAYIWNTKCSNPIARLTGHTAEVTCVAWRSTASIDTIIVTCSDDLRHKIWRIGPEMLPENWQIEGRGEAEPLNNLTKCAKRPLVNNHVLSPNKKLKKCNTCLYIFDKICENCNYQTNIKKRIVNNEDDEHLCKKLMKKTSQRCLFQTINNQEQHISNHTTVSCKRKRSLDDDSFELSTHENRKNSAGINVISNNVNVQKEDEYSGKDIAEEPSNNYTFTPLSNLPNFVIDGCAPHLQTSPQKRPDRDWLTSMRIRKNLVKKYEGLTQGNENTNDKINETQKISNTPQSNRRRHNCSAPRSPLLKFFKINNGQASPQVNF